jgi:hypothetical protein
MSYNKYIIFFLIVLKVNAQVGINSSSPNATLDIIGKPTITTEMDGVIPPRISGNQLQAKTYGTNQNGAIVYVTQATTSPSGQTLNVTSAGLYFFNSVLNRWVALGSNTSVKNIFCNTNDPNSASIFDDEFPVVTNDPTLIHNVQYTYFGLDGSVWIWDGTNYVSFNIDVSLNPGERVSVFKTMATSVANNTILPASGLIELDGIVRIDLRKANNTFYSPRVLNISGSSQRVTYQTFATNFNQNENVINGSLANNSAYEIDADNSIYWDTYNTEIVTTNLILQNGKWYEIQWYAYEVGSIKQIYMTALRKF